MREPAAAGYAVLYTKRQQHFTCGNKYRHNENSEQILEIIRFGARAGGREGEQQKKEPHTRPAQRAAHSSTTI